MRSSVAGIGLVVAAAAMAAGAAEGLAGRARASSGYVWRLPLGFPEPCVPEDNPMSDARVELGRRLFYDPRLSGNGMQSCASCHRPDLAFTDGRPRAIGSTGERHPRGSQ